MRQFDTTRATFRPTRTDDLRPGVELWIGCRLTWQAAYIMDEGPYEGEWAMMPLDHDLPVRFPAAWVPLCDLAIIDGDGAHI
jgi:hypothetical protein